MYRWLSVTIHVKLQHQNILPCVFRILCAAKWTMIRPEHYPHLKMVTLHI
jgi:hypothetical protein